MVVEVGDFSLRSPIDKPDLPSEVGEVGVDRQKREAESIEKRR